MGNFRSSKEVDAAVFPLLSALALVLLAAGLLGTSGCESPTNPRIEPVPPDAASIPGQVAPPEA